MKQHRQHKPPRSQRAHRLGPVFAALLALFLQAFVLQTHVHAVAEVAPAIQRAQAGGEHATDSSLADAKHAQACVICATLHGSSRALAATSQELAPQLGEDIHARAFAARAPPCARAHAYRSRAPPSFL